MKWCPIAETPDLERWNTGRTVRFALAQKCLHDPKMMGYFRPVAGVTTILDNGAHEAELLTFKAYTNLLMVMTPTIAVLPDCVRDPWMTKYLATSFLQYWQGYSLNCDLEWMYVIHESNPTLMARQIIHTTTPWVGLPKWTAIDKYTRVKAMELIRDLGVPIPCKIHALGATTIDEAIELSALGVDSMDSDRPIREKWSYGWESRLK